MSYPGAIYKTGEPVMVGDHVEFRTWPELWLVKHQGRVVYVPGVSPPNSILEDENLKWACIEFRGTKFGPLVHPETGILRGIGFLKRSDDNLRSTPDDFDFPEDEQENEEAQQGVSHQPAKSFSVSFQDPFNRAGGRTFNVRKNMKTILLIILLPMFIGCGLAPAPDPRMSKNVKVSKDESGKTITLHQKIIRPHPSGISAHLPSGTYKHVATGTGYFYFKAPKPIAYLHPQKEKSLSSTGGIAISKTMLQPCYIYMDEDPGTSPGTKMWTWMLGMEFISEEGDVWWKRNY